MASTTRSKEFRSGARRCPVLPPYPRRESHNGVVKKERQAPLGELEGPNNPYGGTRKVLR